MSHREFDADLARYIDHTLLKPDAGELEIIRLCEEARTHDFASVCINPTWIKLCRGILGESAVAVCTVVGFPLGCNRTDVKVRETELAAADGASEFDMVMHIGRFKDDDFAYVEHDIADVLRAAQATCAAPILKVILETSLLNERQIADACRLAVAAGADYVKSSTGFGPGGATIASVRAMRDAVGNRCGVKASGGIRDRETALAMLAAGANRLGTSSGVSIISNR